VSGRDRGQLVLVAAVLVAVALAPVVLASLQLGYHDDVRATAANGDPTADTVRVLDRAVTRESGTVPRNYSWAARESSTNDSCASSGAEDATESASVRSAVSIEGS